MRDIELEMKIQKSLNEGNNVWVVGDVHGFNQTLRSLVAKLEIKTWIIHFRELNILLILVKSFLSKFGNLDY